MREMRRRPQRKTGDPIGATDNRVRFEMKQIDAFADGGRSNGAAFFHDQAIRQNPGEADARSWMNLKTKLFFEKRTP